MIKYAKYLLVLCVLCACSQKEEPKNLSELTITTQNGVVKYMVESAITPQQMEKGLMDRDSMPQNNGMIFNINPVRPVIMWMKDTKIPLDMLFVAPDGTIAGIVEKAEPMSEKHLPSPEPVRAVIEINGGQVALHNIKVGDKVSHRLINNLTDNGIPTEPAAVTPKAQAQEGAAGPVPLPKTGGPTPLPKAGGPVPLPKAGGPTPLPKPGN